MLAAGGSAGVAQIAILVLTALTLLLLIDSDFTRNAGEYVAVVLMAAAGGLIISAAQDLLVIFIGLELLSARPLHPDSLQQAIRQERRSRDQVLPFRRNVDGISALRVQLSLRAFRLDKPATRCARHATSLRPTAARRCSIIALVMVAAGLGFKVAAVPFHLWAPDTYEGAPAPAAAFIASVSKVASFALLISIGTVALHFVHELHCSRQAYVTAYRGGNSAAHASRLLLPPWPLILMVLSVRRWSSATWPRWRRSSVRRLLAYSAIAHAGYILLGLAFFSLDERAARRPSSTTSSPTA